MKRGTDTFLCNASLTDARAFDNPLIVGVHHFFKIGVGETFFGKTHADASDAGAEQSPECHG